MVIERAFGILKRKWKILRGIEHEDEGVWKKIITVCFILHNMYLRVKDLERWEKDDDENAERVSEADVSARMTDKEWRDLISDEMFDDQNDC